MYVLILRSLKVQASVGSEGLLVRVVVSKSKIKITWWHHKRLLSDIRRLSPEPQKTQLLSFSASLYFVQCLIVFCSDVGGNRRLFLPERWEFICVQKFALQTMILIIIDSTTGYFLNYLVTIWSQKWPLLNPSVFRLIILSNSDPITQRVSNNCCIKYCK